MAKKINTIFNPFELERDLEGCNIGRSFDPFWERQILF